MAGWHPFLQPPPWVEIRGSGHHGDFYDWLGVTGAVKESEISHFKGESETGQSPFCSQAPLVIIQRPCYRKGSLQDVLDVLWRAHS